MKKVYLIIGAIVIVIISLFLFFKLKNDSLEDVLTKAKRNNKYELVCDMEMVQNDELKSYEVKVDFLICLEFSQLFLHFYNFFLSYSLYNAH